MTRITYAEARNALVAAQKPGAGVPAYLRWVNRPLGGRVAVIAATLGLSPNAVTGISAALGLAGIGVLAGVTEVWSGPVAALLLLACYVFDSADGQLARIQQAGGPSGEWLDHVVDAIRAPLVHIAIAIKLFRVGSADSESAIDQPLILLIVVSLLFSAMVSAWFLSQILAEKLLPPVKKSVDDHRRGIMESFIKQPQDSSTTYLIIAVVGVLPLFAIFYVALFLWQLLVFAVSLRRKYSNLIAL